MTVVSQTFSDRWRSGDHVGVAAPTQVVRIRSGHFAHVYEPWTGPKVRASIPGETKSKPWRAVWRPDSGWMEVPGVMEVNVDQTFDGNGVSTASIVVENILYQALVHLSVNYYLFKRGALSPLRGYNRPGWPTWYEPDPDWFGVLARGAQIEVQQGYGSEMLPTFSGLIDKIDMTSQPDRITLALRDFGGQPLGQRVFGNVKSKQLREPVIFAPRPKLSREAVASKAKASSARTGHPARFIADKDIKTSWLSATHTIDSFTEWCEIRLTKGRYEDILIHPAYRGMDAYVCVYAKDNNLGGELPQRDGEDIPEAWVDVGLGNVPGANGGIPYIKKLKLDAKGQHVSLGATYELGDDSIVRICFRNLFKVGADQYRAGCVRLAGLREAPSEIIIRPEGYDGRASSTRDAPPGLNYSPNNVCDNDRATRWLSVDHTIASFTEWVEVHLPQGRYRSFNVENAYPGMTMYVGVFARERRSGANSMMDNVEVDEWIDGGLGDVPGANGGWPYLLRIDNAPGAIGKSTKYQFGHKLELGPNSVLRVAYRDLRQAEPGAFRAGAIRLQGNRITYREPEVAEAKRVIYYDDASDIVKVALRWAGFEEWEIEETGTTFNGRLMFSRKDTLGDIVKKVADATGYCFFIAPPSVAGSSLGVPVFREARVLKEDIIPDAVGDWTVLTGIQGSLSQEPLAYIIRVRGAYATKQDGGKMLGENKTRRYMAVYRPPWVRNGRTNGIYIHHIHTDRQLATQADVDLAAILVGLREALAGSACRIEVPGAPQFDLDDQLGVIDGGTGIFSRIYITNRSSRFAQGASQTSWKTTLAGALLDTPDVVETRQDLFDKLSELGLERLQIGGQPVQL